MAFGNWRKFKELREARKHKKILQERGYFVSDIEKGKDGYYYFSILNKRGKNVFFISKEFGGVF